MQDQLYSQMRQLEDTYWWFVGKRRIILGAINQRFDQVLDVGCGTGAMLQELLKISKNVVGLDKNPLAITYAQTRLCKCKLVCADIITMPFADNSFDLIIASDVLEHCDDDQAGLREIIRVLKPGGRLIITLPAFNFLWGPNDLAACHKRRYDLNQLKLMALKQNLVIEKISYANFFVFPFVLITRLFQRIFKSKQPPTTDFFYTPDLINKLFIMIYYFEAWILKQINFPWGVSLLGVFKK